MNWTHRKPENCNSTLNSKSRKGRQPKHKMSLSLLSSPLFPQDLLPVSATTRSTSSTMRYRPPNCRQRMPMRLWQASRKRRKGTQRRVATSNRRTPSMGARGCSDLQAGLSESAAQLHFNSLIFPTESCISEGSEVVTYRCFYEHDIAVCVVPLLCRHSAKKNM